jgi:hypothetical protein
MRPSAHVHLVSADRDALLDVVEAAERQFVELGIAPDERRIDDLSAEAARRYAAADPNAADGDRWFPHLSPEALAEAVDGDARLHHAGIEGMVVIDRVVREETTGDPAVVLQTDDRQAGVARGYTVYRYAGVVDAYTEVSTGKWHFDA